MRTALSIPMGAALAALLLTACAKPVDKTAADATAATATAADSAAANTAAAAGGVADPGGAVSPPSAQNGAVNTDANTTEATQTPGSNSFTEAQAQGHIENAGYGNVTGLTKTADGMWTGKATKGGKTMDVSVDFKGAVSAK